MNKEVRGINEIRITAPILDSVPFHRGSSPHRGSPTATEPRDDFRGIHHNTEYVFCEKEKVRLKVEREMVVETRPNGPVIEVLRLS